MRLLPLVLASCSSPPAPVEPLDREVEPTAVVPFQELGPASPRLSEGQRTPSVSPRTVGFLQTDKPVYQPGDAVWVATRRVDADLAPVATDGDGTLILIDPRGGEVEEKLVRETHGHTTNDFVLPIGAAGGVWKVRAELPGATTLERDLVVVAHDTERLQKKLDFLRKAYVPGDTVVATVSVKGVDGQPLAGQPLTPKVSIGGSDLPVDPVTTDADGAAIVRFVFPQTAGDDASLTVLVAEGGSTESVSRRVPVDRDSIAVALFPEGGALVVGLPSRVYFAATRPDGKPGDVSGRVVDDLGREVASFVSFHHGLGRFALTPEAGRAYHLALRGSTRELPLPEALATGCVLSTAADLDSRAPQIRAEIRCSAEQDVVVRAAVRGRELDGARVHVPAGDAARVYLDAKDAVGAVRVSLYDAAGEPLAERAVFRRRGRELRVEVKPRGDSFGPRDDVAVDIKATTPEGAPVQADLSLVVVDDSVLTWADDKQGDLVSAMLLESEVPRRIEDPRSYFAEPTGLALDLLLGTAGWRTFVPASPEEPLADRRMARRDQGAKARGRKEALLERAAPGVEQLLADREVAENAGVLGALRGGVDLDQALAGVAGLHAAKGGGFGRAGAGDVKVARAANLLQDSDRAIILGALERDLIAAVVRRNGPSLRFCYQRELQKHPRLAGRVTVKFVIASDGAVSVATTKASTLDSPPVERCINQRFLRFQFPKPRGGGIVIVAFPLRFEPGGEVGEPVEDVPDAPIYATVRSFPAPPALGVARTDFRETVAWLPDVHTDARGQATATFRLSDAITSFRAIVQGVGGGLVGRGDVVLASSLPFSMRVRLPTTIAAGDRLRVPLMLSNTRAAPLDVRVESSLGPARRVQLAARAHETVYYDLDAAQAGTVRFSAEAAGLSDRFERPLRTIDPGFPRAWSASGRLEGTQTHTVLVDEVAGEGPKAWIAAYPNPVATLTEGIDGLLTLPTGCFEQASSTNYPNLLVLRLLEERGGSSAAAARARELLADAYPRLVGYESQGGGYEWFGGFPAHGALTAYGLAEFSQMRSVYEVDAAMLARTRTWLLSRRDGQGGWQVDERAVDSFGRASKPVTDAYILWALATTGSAAQLGRELDAAAAEATEDAYRLALHVDALAGTRPDDAARLGEALARMQDADGAWRRAKESITQSGGRNLHIEATALAVRALLDVGGQVDAVEAGIRWLVGQRDASGRWGSTQGTILTLDALTRYAAKAPAPAPGEASVEVDGRAVGTIAWGASGEGPRLDLPLSSGAHTITVRSTGSPVPYTLGASWSTRLPPSDLAARVGLTTTLGSDHVALGEPVRLNATVRNLTDAGLPMVVAEIGIPAGLETQTWQLRELVDTHAVDLYETRAGKVYLYWRSFGPTVTRVVPLDLIATVPGVSTGAASDAWLYYDDDAKSWAAGLRVEVGA